MQDGKKGYGLWVLGYRAPQNLKPGTYNPYLYGAQRGSPRTTSFQQIQREAA